MKFSDKTDVLAHVRQDQRGKFIVHNLEEHLLGVASFVSGFASQFGNSDWAYLSGLWHDLGKYSKGFQRRIKLLSGYDPEAHLEGKPGRVDHSTAGALHAIEQFGMPFSSFENDSLYISFLSIYQKNRTMCYSTRPSGRVRIETWLVLS